MFYVRKTMAFAPTFNFSLSKMNDSINQRKDFEEMSYSLPFWDGFQFINSSLYLLSSWHGFNHIQLLYSNLQCQVVLVDVRLSAFSSRTAQMILQVYKPCSMPLRTNHLFLHPIIHFKLKPSICLQVPFSHLCQMCWMSFAASLCLLILISTICLL